MKVNIFGSTGYIGKKSLSIINNYFPDLKINLLCANRNINILKKQIKIYKPKYVYLFDEKQLIALKKIITKKTKILNKKDLFVYLNLQLVLRKAMLGYKDALHLNKGHHYRPTQQFSRDTLLRRDHLYILQRLNHV